MALSLRQLGKVEESLARLRQARLHPNVIAEDDVWIRSLRDGPGEIRRLLAERLRLVKNKEADSEVVLVPAADADDVDTAVDALERMWQARRIELLQLRVSPRFDTLRSDPRFIALDRRVWRD